MINVIIGDYFAIDLTGYQGRQSVNPLWITVKTGNKINLFPTITPEGVVILGADLMNSFQAICHEGRRNNQKPLITQFRALFQNLVFLRLDQFTAT
jgi:hypothetical protein